MTSLSTKPHGPSIGLAQLTAYYLSNLVGAGIFVIPALAQDAAGPWVLLAWLLMVVGAIPTAWVMCRISMDYPDDNGILRFIGVTVSARLTGAISKLIVLIMVIGNPIMGVISARYAIAAFGLDASLLYVLAIGFMLVSVAFNMMGLRSSARVQTVLVAVAMTTLIVLASLSVGMADRFVPQSAPVPVNGIMMAMGICFFAFLGWENVATIAPDVKNPGRNFPLALIICVPLVGAIYLIVALALLLTTQETGLQGNFAVMDHLVAVFANPTLSFGVNLLALAVVVLSTNAWVLSAARLLSSGVRDGHLPAVLSRGTGGIDPLTMGTLALAYSGVIGLMYLFQGGEESIVPFVSAGFLVIYLVAFWGAIKRYRHSMTWWFAVFGIAMIGLFAVSTLVDTLLVLVLLTSFLLLDRQRSLPRQSSN